MPVLACVDWAICLTSGTSPCKRKRHKRIRGHDGTGRHAGFRFLCSDALGFKSPCPHQENRLFLKLLLSKTACFGITNSNSPGQQVPIRGQREYLSYLAVEKLGFLSYHHPKHFEDAAWFVLLMLYRFAGEQNKDKSDWRSLFCDLDERFFEYITPTHWGKWDSFHLPWQNIIFVI